MRVLITAFPGHGHLAPLIPLAAAIRDAGHEVAFATSESCREGLAVHDLTLEPCGPVWREADFGRSEVPHNPLADLVTFLETEAVPRTLADLETAVARRRPDLILSNDFEPVGRIVAERTGIPFVLASSGPRLGRSERLARHGHVLRGARRHAGLPEEGGLDYSLRWLHLCFAPRDWVFTGSVKSMHGVHEPAPNEFGIRPRIADLGVPPGIAELDRNADARPAALCTFGTVFNKSPELLRIVIAAVAPQVARLIVVPGPGAPPDALGALPSGVEVHAEASAAAFLPHVDYVVTHGGAGTLTALQLRGLPSLLLPQGADQPINAAACLRSGISVVRFHTIAAIIVGAKPSLPTTVESVAGAFAELRSEPIYRRRAQALRASFEALPPVEYAVGLLERLVVTKAPVLANRTSVQGAQKGGREDSLCASKQLRRVMP